MEKTLKTLAKEAKARMKKGFWQQCQEDLESERTHAKEQGINERKMERYFQQKVTTQIKGEVPDDFYLKVRKNSAIRSNSPSGICVLWNGSNESTNLRSEGESRKESLK